jgi:hypothetical protein
MDNFLMDTVIDKIKGQENRLERNENRMSDLEIKVAEVESLEVNITNLIGIIQQLENKMDRIDWLKEQLTELSFKIKLNNDLLANPAKNKQTIVHTAEKSIWIIVVLVFLLNILIMVSIDINRKLDQYKTNDILWRALKVNSNTHELFYLQSIEKLYDNDPDKFKSGVFEAERVQKQILESEINNVPRTKKDSVRLSRSKHIQ